MPDYSDIRTNRWFLRVIASPTWQSISARHFGYCAQMDVTMARLPHVSRLTLRSSRLGKHLSAFLPRPRASSRVSPDRLRRFAPLAPCGPSCGRSCGAGAATENCGVDRGHYFPSVTEIVRSQSCAHNLLRPLINRGRGGNLFPVPAFNLLFLASSSSPAC